MFIIFYQYSFYTIVFKPKFNHINSNYIFYIVIKIEYYLNPRFSIFTLVTVRYNIRLLSWLSLNIIATLSINCHITIINTAIIKIVVNKTKG